MHKRNGKHRESRYGLEMHRLQFWKPVASDYGQVAKIVLFISIFDSHVILNTCRKKEHLFTPPLFAWAILCEVQYMV